MFAGPSCDTWYACSQALGSGYECIGHLPGETTACSVGGEDECVEGVCRPEWFVTCDPGFGGWNGACVDARFGDADGDCHVATVDFQGCDLWGGGGCSPRDAGARLSECDENGRLDDQVCCQQALGAEPDPEFGDELVCDPLEQANVVAVERFERSPELPKEARECVCDDPGPQPLYCADDIRRFCTPPWGELETHDGSSNEGRYLHRFVTAPGGVIYDPATKGVRYLPADTGRVERAFVERCAEATEGLEPLHARDGWRMHDARGESVEDFDRAMCSASRYELVLANEPGTEHIVDKVGNRLRDDELRYAFETADFHVVPDGGFPTDELRIGPCDEFELRLSNKYDLSPTNLRKIELVAIERSAAGEDALGEPCATSSRPECWTELDVVAGGPSCTEDGSEVALDRPPCLSVSVADQSEGVVRVWIDARYFGIHLWAEPEQAGAVDDHGFPITGRYRLRVPALAGYSSFAELERDLDDPAARAAYASAFHDVCGMPLVDLPGAPATVHDFTIDPASCSEDEDGDGIGHGCDVDPRHHDPDQRDQDHDGVGDFADRCPLVPYSGSDYDRDGVGDACDTCWLPVDQYYFALPDDPRLWPRRTGSQVDTDQDGIGDACDNCIPMANCLGFGPDDPHQLGDPTLDPWYPDCQVYGDASPVGLDCVGEEADGRFYPFATGPVTLAPTDDFDQDGLDNAVDLCPRLRVDDGEPIPCSADQPCAPGRQCSLQTGGFCNHRDSDGDMVGDACDTCPHVANPMQVTDGGMQIDDLDGDGIGAACEGDVACETDPDPRPYAFMAVAVDGACCATIYPGDGRYVPAEDGTWACEGLCDPDGFPVTIDCATEADPLVDEPDGVLCRKLPEAVFDTPGVVDLPPGCEDALADAGACLPGPDCPPEQANRTLTLQDVPDRDELWAQMCWLPAWDQDFDGLHDACDLCPFAYDPLNLELDIPGGSLAGHGRYCNGDYSPEALCEDEDEDEDEGVDEDAGTDTDDEGEDDEGLPGPFDIGG